MDRLESRARLDWWANSVTLLASLDVTVDITADDAGWHAHGTLTNDTAETRETLAFFRDLDPVSRCASRTAAR
ncbi:hypothetical protein [Dactylosporangium sp. NPDC051541]|uniref:hypothetical protein n=1 Tax=Dactylosporangium sp. NPDC051541 TaxID=3363977 RepID=UPI0037ABEABF